MKRLILSSFVLVLFFRGLAQDTTRVDTSIVPSTHVIDSTLRIININPYFTQHVDSMLSYQFSDKPGSFKILLVYEKLTRWTTY